MNSNTLNSVSDNASSNLSARQWSSSCDDPVTYVGGRWATESAASEETVSTEVGEETRTPEGGFPMQSDVPRTRGFFLTRMKTGECFELVGDAFVVGKSRDASYQLRNTDTISRMHACFRIIGDECWVEDNNSLNGTFVNGTKLPVHCRVKVESGARIQLSDESFLLEVRAL